MIPVLFIAGIITLVVLSIVFAAQQQKKRTAAMQEQAETLGLTFLEDGSGGLEQQLASFALMNRGRGRKYRNVVTASTDDVAIALFDYQYVTGHGKNRRTHNQSVAAIQSRHIRMPVFRARPEGLFDGVGSVLGFQDIDFDEHKAFSDAFVLKSEFEDETRRYFDLPLLDFFADKTKLTFEGQGQTFLFFERKHRTKPENIKFLLEESYRVFGALRDRASRT